MKKIDISLPVAGLAVLLAGCASPTVPSSATQPWTPSRDAQKTDATWRDIRTQKPDLSKPLGLPEMAGIALQNNPATRKAWSDARAAAAQVEQARGYFMPAFTAVAGANRQYTMAEPKSFNQDYLKYGPGLQMNYLVLNFGGGTQAAVEEALQTVYAADFSFNRAIQDVLVALETAYYGMVSAQAAVAAAEASVKDAKTALDAAKTRLSAGVGTQLEVLQAQTGYDQSLYNLASVQGQAQIARGLLAQALGIPADSDLQVAPPPADIPEALGTPDMRRMIDDALARRPDISALRASLAAKQAAIKVAGAPLWPSLFLNGSVNRDYYDNIGAKALQDHDWSWNGGISLDWSLFDGFQTLSAKHGAQAQAESLQAQLQQAELAASADVWTRYHNYATALQKHKFSLAFLTSAGAAYDQALQSYQAGLQSILDLLNAESQLAQARSQSIAARQEVFTALANLAYATGILEKGGSAQTQGLFSTPTTKDIHP